VITNIQFWSHLAQFILQLEMFQTKAVEKIQTHVLGSMTSFSKIMPFVENYCKVQQAAVDSTVHAHYILGALGYKHALLEYVKGKVKAVCESYSTDAFKAYCALTRKSSFIHLQRRCTHQAA